MTETETWVSYMLRSGLFQFWTGRTWSIHLHKAKQFAMQADAEKAIAKAGRHARVIECSITIPRSTMLNSD